MLLVYSFVLIIICWYFIPMNQRSNTFMLSIAALLCCAIWWFVEKSELRQQPPEYALEGEAVPSRSIDVSHAKRIDATAPSNAQKYYSSRSLPQVPPESTPPKPSPELEDSIPGEYLFKFYNEQDRRAFEEYARKHGIRIIDFMAVGNVVRVGISDRSILEELLRNGPISTDWMPNTYVRVPEREDNVPLTPPSGGYQAFGDRALKWLGIKDNSGWGQGISVAVLDSGVIASGALSGRNIMQIDLIGESSYAAAHGTAVASIIAGGDATGVAPAVDLMSIKVMSNAGTGDSFTLAKGIIEAVDRGAQIINMSLGSNSDSFVVRQAVKYAAERGVLLVAAAGNDARQGLLYPARYEDVIAVAGVDFNSKHLYFSNRGSAVDIAAPGAGVAATGAGGETIGFSGTSVASPFVAGAAAEVWARDSSLSSEDIRRILIDYSNDVGAPGRDESYGAGVLDVGRINSRNTSGIFDMTAMMPFVQNNKSGGTVDISAQNRGTETIAEMVLEVDFQGKKESFSFFNVQPGNTISQPFPFGLIPEDGMELRFSVRPSGVNDATPNNNAVFSIISAQ